jgi:hypothetical protein
VFHRVAGPVTILGCVLLAGGAALGASLRPGDRLAGGLAGAALGVALTLAAALHLIVRTADGRGIAHADPEAQPDSVEMQVWRAAASHTCADALGIGSLVAILCLMAPDSALVHWLPLAGLLATVLDLAVRARVGWRAAGADDA